MKLFKSVKSNQEFNFHIKGRKELLCDVTENGEFVNKNLQVDIPKNLDLSDENVVENLKTYFLSKSFFNVFDNSIVINPRGDGGFGDDIHYEKTKEIAIKVFSQGQHGLIATNPAIEDIAELIAQSCQNVDEWNMGISPLTDSSWHFNTNEINEDNYDWAIWGTKRDTRWEKVIENLEQFSELKNQLATDILQEQQGLYMSRVERLQQQANISILVNNMLIENYQAYSTKFQNLGYGLHALQDMIAHLPHFVRRECQIFCHHLLNLKVDKMYFMPEREYYIEKATKLYLKGDLRALTDKIQEARTALRQVANFLSMEEMQEESSGCRCG